MPVPMFIRPLVPPDIHDDTDKNHEAKEQQKNQLGLSFPNLLKTFGKSRPIHLEG